MNEIDVNKAVITVINAVIVLGIPCMFTWHIEQIKKTQVKSEDWLIQMLILFSYFSAFAAEIPAFWSRWKAYYSMHMTLPDSLYVLTTWDREAHGFFYVVMFVLTYTFTVKKVPKIVDDILG